MKSILFILGLCAIMVLGAPPPARSSVNNGPSPAPNMTATEFFSDMCAEILSDISEDHIGFTTALHTLAMNNLTLPIPLNNSIILAPSDDAFQQFVSYVGKTAFLTNISLVSDLVKYHIASFAYCTPLSMQSLRKLTIIAVPTRVQSESSIALTNLLGTDLQLENTTGSPCSVSDVMASGNGTIMGQALSATLTDSPVLCSNASQAQYFWPIDQILLPRTYYTSQNASIGQTTQSAPSSGFLAVSPTPNNGSQVLAAGGPSPPPSSKALLKCCVGAGTVASLVIAMLIT